MSELFDKPYRLMSEADPESMLARAKVYEKMSSPAQAVMDSGSEKAPPGMTQRKGVSLKLSRFLTQTDYGLNHIRWGDVVRLIKKDSFV